MTVGTRIEHRRDTATNWTTANPTLLAGEPALETDTGRQKIGDGATAWASLPYATGTNNRFRFDAAHLPHWTKALANVRNGLKDAKLLCAGDSTTSGIGSATQSTIPANNSYPARLATLLNSYLAPAANGLAIPPSNLGTLQTDQRWTPGTGWSVNTSTGLGFGGSSVYQGATPSGSLVFADPRIQADTFDVYYLTAGSGGSIGITPTGGSTTNQSLNGASGIGKVTVTAGSAATSNSVTITGTGTVWVVGIEPYLSTATKVRVGNAGVGSSRADAWANTDPSTFGSIPAIKAYAPDLTIVMLGINDGTDQRAAATVLTDILALITAAQISGDAILMSMIPSNPTVNSGHNAAFEALYVPLFAAQTSLAFADVYTRSGGFTAWNALGMMYSDGIHGTDYAYWDIAQFLFDGLRSV